MHTCIYSYIQLVTVASYHCACGRGYIFISYTIYLRIISRTDLFSRPCYNNYIESFFLIGYSATYPMYTYTAW